jgi:hypothetical protein
MDTALTAAQYKRLDKLPEHAKVVGWSWKKRGPIIAIGGERQAINRLGILCPA